MLHTFTIESHHKAHVLYLDEEPLGSYPTVEAAEAGAQRVADQMQPGASLDFKLDQGTTLADFEIRVATLEVNANGSIDR
jgi:hypothetical protein